MELDVDTYARIHAALAEGTTPRADVLGQHGLDEDGWSEIDDAWQDRLSRAIDDHDGDGVPPLVAAFDAALRQARAGLATGEALSFEQFAAITRQLQRGGDAAKALAEMGFSFAALLRASNHWTGRMASDGELADRFRRLTRGG